MKIISERELELEKERLCLLIASKIKREELTTARKFAEELFKEEIEALLIKNMERLRRYRASLQRISLFFAGVLLGALLLMVLNIRPFLDLKIEGLVLIFIVSVLMVNIFMVRRFSKQTKRLANVYEEAKRSFVVRVIRNIGDCTRATRDDITHLGER